MKIGALALAGAMLVTSCTSSYKANAGMRGALIGGRVGEAIGAISGHGFYSGKAAWGSLIGTGVGALLGVGIASAIEEKERKAYENSNGYDQRDYAPSYDQRDYTPSYSGRPLGVSVTNLRYLDADGDGWVKKGETIEIQAYINNTSGRMIRDLTLCLAVSDERHYTVSHPLTTELGPNQRIRYTGRVYCKKASRGDAVKVWINASCGQQVHSSEAIVIGER